MIYFDTAASYPVLPEVQATLEQAFKLLYANSSSNHSLGEQSRCTIDNVRQQLADEIAAYPSEIVFTSGATESNNIAFKSLLFSCTDRDKNHIVTTQIEHKCIFSICNYLESIGYNVTYVKPDNYGVISAESIQKAITPKTTLVSVMHVNNELGTINPIAEIGQVCFMREFYFIAMPHRVFKKSRLM